IPTSRCRPVRANMRCASEEGSTSDEPMWRPADHQPASTSPDTAASRNGGPCARDSRHGDDDLAARVPLLEVAQAGSRIGQEEGAVEDGCESPGLDERGDGKQVFAVPLVRQWTQPLPDDDVDGEQAQNPADR